MILLFKTPFFLKIVVRGINFFQGKPR